MALDGVEELNPYLETTMTHGIMAMLVAVLLQPPATPPAKPEPEPAPKFGDEGLGQRITLDMAVPTGRSAVTHPDIRIAEARLMEAQATLDQVKRKVAIESALNKAKYDQAKADVATKTKEFERFEALHKSGALSAEEHAKASAELQTAKRQLAFAELLNQGDKEAAQAPKQVMQQERDDYYRNITLILGANGLSRSDRTQSQPLAELLQRKVKLAVKATDADKSIIGVLERSMKEWDFAAAKVIVRYPRATTAAVKDAPTMHTVDGENAVGIWMLLMLDEFNGQNEQLPESMRGKHQIYVREYGLLFTLVKNAPDGAPTLAEFLRQAKK